MTPTQYEHGPEMEHPEPSPSLTRTTQEVTDEITIILSNITTFMMYHAKNHERPEIDRDLAILRERLRSLSSPASEQTRPPQPEPGEFHWRDGVFFRRTEGGNVSVRIAAGGPFGPSHDIRLSIPPVEWDSITGWVAK